MSLVKRALFNLSLAVLGVIAAGLILEVALRCYNPFHFRVKAGKIALTTNIKFRTENYQIRKLDRVIVHSKNSLGFRGDPPPRDFAQWLTIVAVGGSTTECFYLSDGKTWSDNLGRLLKRDFQRVWVNNAGLDGHSTFGHIRLLQDYLIPLKPKCALFLVGINDIYREDLSSYDESRDGLHLIKAGKGFSEYLASHSEFYSLMINLMRYLEGYKRGLCHKEIILKDQAILEQVDAHYAAESKNSHRERYLPPFARRLQALIGLCREHGIEPILITQPVLFGDGIDKPTGVNLATVKIDTRINGKLQWELIELYNEVTREIGRQEHVLVIDLARKMPKDSRYYYDYFHFTNEGAEKVADLIHRDLSPYLASQYQSYLAAGKKFRDLRQPGFQGVNAHD